MLLIRLLLLHVRVSGSHHPIRRFIQTRLGDYPRQSLLWRRRYYAVRHGRYRRRVRLFGQQRSEHFVLAPQLAIRFARRDAVT